MIPYVKKQSEVVCGVVVNPRGFILLVKHINGSWLLPKGRILYGEDHLAAIKRSICEVSGLNKLHFVKQLGHYSNNRAGFDEYDDPNKFKIFNVMLIRTTQEKLDPIHHNISEARWVPISGVAELLTHQEDKDFFKSVQKDIP